MIVNVIDKTFDVHAEKHDGKLVIHINEVEGKTKLLSFLKPGDVFRGRDGTEYIVCERLLNGTAVVRKDVLSTTMTFGNDNNWANSNWRKYLNSEYLKEIGGEFGEENIIEHEVNLLSMDGYDDYGIVHDKVSAMTFDRYRKYHKYIGNALEWNWLSTPDSTPSGIGASGVRCVRDGGGVGYADRGRCGGLRPFFVLKSDIQVEKE